MKKEKSKSDTDIKKFLESTHFFNKNGNGKEVKIAYVPLSELYLTVRF